MMKMIQSKGLAMMLGMVVYLTTTVLCWKQPELSHEVADDENHEALPDEKVSWNFFNPEVEMLVSELKKEKEALAQRKTELDDLAARLQSERQEINQVTQKVFQMQKEFDGNLIRIREDEAANIKRLAKMYATMSPEGAAVVFKQMDDVTAVKIMATMKDTETAPVLESLAKQSEADAKRVAAISDRLRLMVPLTPKKAAP